MTGIVGFEIQFGIEQSRSVIIDGLEHRYSGFGIGHGEQRLNMVVTPPGKELGITFHNVGCIAEHPVA